MRQQLKVEGWSTKGGGGVWCCPCNRQLPGEWSLGSSTLLSCCFSAPLQSLPASSWSWLLSLLPCCHHASSVVVIPPSHSPPFPLLLLFLINVFCLPFPSAFVTFLCFFFSRVRWKNFAHNNKMAAGIFESCALAYAIEMVTLSLSACVSLCVCGRSCCCSDKQAACFASPSPSPAPLAVVVAVDVYFVFFCCSCCCRLSAQRLKFGSFFGWIFVEKNK